MECELLVAHNEQFIKGFFESLVDFEEILTAIAVAFLSFDFWKFVLLFETFEILLTKIWFSYRSLAKKNFDLISSKVGFELLVIEISSFLKSEFKPWKRNTALRLQ